jgi:hypothetical protein
LITQEKYTELLLWHKGVEHFDYGPVIDWAIELIRNGQETENVLILASFSKPIDSDEIRPYVSGALKELGLKEKYEAYSSIAQTHYALAQILADVEVRRHLTDLYQVSLESNFEPGLNPFYLLYHAWSSLETDGTNYYYEDVTLENIKEALNQEAEMWINQYVHGMEPEVSSMQPNQFSPQGEPSKKPSIWARILRLVRRNWMMKHCFVILFLFISITIIQAQRQEITLGINHNHFYDFRKKARNFESKDGLGASLGLSIDNMEAKKFPYRATVKFDRYRGQVDIFNGGLGGGSTLNADVTKNMIAIGLYPLNFSLKHVLDFNIGVEFNALILENAEGQYAYYQGGSPPISYNKPLTGATKASNRFGIGLIARVAYYIPIQKGWFLVPQYQIFSGTTNEFKDVGSETRSLRHYLAIGLARKMPKGARR